MAATAKSVEFRAVAQRVADALPAAVEEVVLTGSVSRGIADDVSDIEMLIVTPGEPDLDECFSLAAHAGLSDLGTWGPQGVPTKRVSGYREAVPLEPCLHAQDTRRRHAHHRQGDERASVVEEHVCEVLGRVPRRRDRAQDDPAEVELFFVPQRAVLERDL